MNLFKILAILPLIIALSCSIYPKRERQSGYPITPVSFTTVTLTDDFWAKRLETNRTVTIPFGFEKCEIEGRIRNFERAGGLLAGRYEGYMPFDDSDVYKIIEGASYSLTSHPDTVLGYHIDTIIAKIAAAQEEDGYLCTWKTINPDSAPAPWVKPGPRWHDLRASHELYNMGHLYEAAFAHYQATGKRDLLNIALKNADLIDRTFGPGKKMDPPGHQIIETGLVKLYLATHDIKYLNLAKFFLDQRGNIGGHELMGAYNQDHLPVIAQKEAVGHAVRAVYMYAGMTDIAAMMRDEQYMKAVDALWQNVVEKKLYITGGIGARHEGESFGDNYELPNLTSYNETCAAIGNIYWNQRMFLLHGDAKYIDVLERTLYNGMIAGVSLEGDTFFYPNCLASDGKYKFNMGALTRQAWFDCSCCPSNVMRFLPSVPGYLYAQRMDTLFINLFISNTARIVMQNTILDIEQRSGYPRDGKVTITLNPQTSSKISIHLRIPGWVSEKPLPGNLYHYKDKNSNTVSLKVNSQPVEFKIEKGFAVISRTWMKGDVIELNLPMEVRRVMANEKVQADRNKVALVRGPLVYCTEWIDNGGSVLDLVLPDETKLMTEFKPELLGGITVITGIVADQTGRKRNLRAIPYYAWSHRGAGEMTVWLNINKE
jgi:DUF1680 family protein